MMTIKRLHYISGITISVFILLHLFNHFCSIFGADKHIEVMNILRLFYRNVLVETILLAAVFIQIISGLKLFSQKRKKAMSGFDKLHIYSGLYLAFFLVIHVGVIFIGRFYLHLNTNFYFGAAGLNTFPYSLFFIPYYALAIISVFGHIASVHKNKMNRNLLGLTPVSQAKFILLFGAFLTVMILYGLTNHFKGVTIPHEYNILIGK
jgi:hypothetical protein